VRGGSPGRASRAVAGGQRLRAPEAIERDALIALPPRVFELTSWSIGTVGVDANLKVGKALYSVPWRLIGQRLHGVGCHASWRTAMPLDVGSQTSHRNGGRGFSHLRGGSYNRGVAQTSLVILMPTRCAGLTRVK
jgi:hypothetical protein